MWEVLLGILALIMIAAFVGVVVGLIVGVTRRAWKILKYSGAALGVAFVLAIIIGIAAPEGSFEEATNESAATEAPKPTVTAARAIPAEEIATPKSTTIPVPRIVRENEGARKSWENAEERCDRGDMRAYKGVEVAYIAQLVELRAAVAEQKNNTDARDYDYLPTDTERELLTHFLKNSPDASSSNDWSELYDIHRRLIYTALVLSRNLVQMGIDESSTSEFVELLETVNNQFACRTAELQQQ